MPTPWYITKKEVFAMAALDDNRLAKMTAERDFPKPVRVGRAWRWDKYEVRAWITKARADKTFEFVPWRCKV